MPELLGRTAIVTGASSGLGEVVARELAGRGAHVIMAVRDTAKGERVRRAILTRMPGVSIEVAELDLLDLVSVRGFAAAEAVTRRPVDLLVNNAGIGASTRALSPQGFESTWATNVVGAFALTGLLLPNTAAGARVVWVGSNLYRRLRVDLPLDDPAATSGFSAARAYTASKLADIMLGVELDRRLRAAASDMRSLVAHPGVADTPMQRGASRRVERLIGAGLRLAFGRSVDAGALPLLYAATAPEAPSGLFLGPSLKKRDLRVHAAALVAPAADRDLAVRLWNVLQDQSNVRITTSALRAAGTS